MTAKSAPQLLHVLLQGPGVRSRNLLVVTLMVLVVGTAWLLDQLDRGLAGVLPHPAAASVDVAVASETAAPHPEVAAPPENSRFRALSEFLARRYKVSQAITLDLVTIAHTAGHQIGLDPLLIIAVMAVESR